MLLFIFREAAPPRSAASLSDLLLCFLVPTSILPHGKTHGLQLLMTLVLRAVRRLSVIKPDHERRVRLFQGSAMFVAESDPLLNDCCRMVSLEPGFEVFETFDHCHCLPPVVKGLGAALHQVDSFCFGHD
jgi:hypothetical protein